MDLHDKLVVNRLVHH